MSAWVTQASVKLNASITLTLTLTPTLTPTLALTLTPTLALTLTLTLPLNQASVKLNASSCTHRACRGAGACLVRVRATLTPTVTLILALALALSLTVTLTLARSGGLFRRARGLPFISLYLPTSPYISPHLPGAGACPGGREVVTRPRCAPLGAGPPSSRAAHRRVHPGAHSPRGAGAAQGEEVPAHEQPVGLGVEPTTLV